jgi:hypothetical protein
MHKCAILKNRIVKRVFMFFLFAGVYIAVLQTWYSQIDASNSVENAATLVKHTATFNTIVHRATINFQSAVYFDANSTSYEDMLTATTKARNETEYTQLYNEFYRVGNSDIIPESYIYDLMMG